MNRAKKILSSLRLANSLYSAHLSRTHSLHTQVTHFSPFLPTRIHIPTSITLNTHQKLFFSSKPEPFVDLVLSNDWSDDTEQELVKSNPKLTHESVMYVLKSCDKDPQKASRFFNWVVNENGFKPSLLMYSLMLRIYANKENIEDFWVLVKEMEEKGSYIEEETYKTIELILQRAEMSADITALKDSYERLIKENAMDDVVKEAVEVIVGLDWGNEVESKLGEMKIPVSDNFVLRVVKEIRRKGYPLRALSFFKWVGEDLNFEHNSVTYNGLLCELARKDSIGEFWEVMKEMKSAGFEMDVGTYTKITRHFQRFKMPKDAVELFEHMMDSPFKPSIRECNLLLHFTIASSPSPDMDLVSRVIKKWEAAGYALSKSIYDAVHKSFIIVGRLDEAKRTVETMKNAGFEPDNITYGQSIIGLCKASKLEEACKMLDVMEKEGCKPDLITCTILIQGLCAANDVDKALEFFANMMEKDIDADGYFLNVLIDGCLSQGRILDAYKSLVVMVNKTPIIPSQATYKNLIEKLLGEKKLEEALDLLRGMKKQNYPPFADPFVPFISKYGTADDAGEFLKALTDEVNPSISAYQRVFESFFSEGKHSDAEDLLRKCLHQIRKDEEISSPLGSAVSQTKRKKVFRKRKPKNLTA